MEFVMLFIFAIVFAMGFNYLMPRFSAKVATYPKLAAHQSSYAGQTVVTATAVFVLLLVVSYVFASVGGRSAPSVS